MAIAIRLDATETSLKSLVDNYTKQGRPTVRVTCPEGKCRQEYIVYYGPSMDEVQLREGLAPYLTIDHPNHPLLYEIEEPTLDDSHQMGAMKATPFYRTLQPSSKKVREVMTKHPVCCVPSDTIQHVASLMKDEEVGCLPVVEEHSSRRLVGVITDRDVCCRATVDGQDPKKTAIEAYITRNVITCLADDELEHCLQVIHKCGIRRVPVVDDEGRCIGIVSTSDAPEKVEIIVKRALAQAIRSTLKKHGIA